ncbi:MAG TPA: S9 family peptidase, partial [Pyrinomonadaceae bacterium]|nr:S9 family peptidase [Pyrinomonadaceae bacterium]
KHLAYLTNTTGTSQVWSIDLPAGTPKPLTNYEDNVSFVRWLPDGGGIIFGKAKGGDENTQFFWMKTDGSGVKQLTGDLKVRHNFAEISDDGKTIYYGSNKRNRNFFDIYSMDLATGREDLVYQQDGSNELAAVNGGGGKFIISRDGIDLSLDNNLYLVDAKTKQETLLTPHTGASQFGDVHFVADGIVFAHNDGREFYSLAQMRKKNAAGDDWSDANREVKILDTINPWDIGSIAKTPYGNTIVYTINREGFSELYLRRVETDGKPRISTVSIRPERIQLPVQGIVGGVTLSDDQEKIAFSFNSATNNGDIWIYDRAKFKAEQVTHSDRAGIDSKSFIVPELIKYKTFDGREIPAWYYRNRVALRNHLPVIVSVHGGPEGQERPGFNPLYQYYLSRGYAVLATNVRGSTGYGKTFTHLDDVRKREDSVKDLAYAVEWLKSKGRADPKRIAVMGGSYGGYMTLAAITLYPELWAAAVDTVGIANWESFLKNTSGYRRRQREVEYGMLDKDIDFLRSISPIAKVDKIKTPLFVIAGKNDPRVPYTEAEQMVGALKERGAVVEYKLYDDEGHGISKLKNRLELYPLVADFLDRYMK